MSGLRSRDLHTQILKRLTEVHRVDSLSGWQTVLVGLVSLPAYVRRLVSLLRGDLSVWLVVSGARDGMAVQLASIRSLASEVVPGSAV
jgi:hypothetical protein